MVVSVTRRWISPLRSDPASALDTAVRFLARRPRSEYEVRRRLARGSCFAPEIIDSVIAQLRRQGLLDDHAFAAYWAEQRQTFRPRGARLVRAELARLGVARTHADAATADLAEEDDAYRAATRYALRLRAADEATFRRRLSQWLARRGFDWETISTVVNRLSSELPH